MTPFHDPTITDITRIAETMGGLKSLSQMLAYALLVLLVPLEAIHQNIKAIEGRAEYTNTLLRVILVFVGLILYDRIFGFIIRAATIVEFSVLSETQWSDLLAQLASFFKAQKLTFMSSLPMIFTWIASFLALLAKNVLYWVRFCLLSVLYFVGPIAFAFNALSATTFLPKAWFKNVIQLSLWTVVMKIIVRVMFELQVMTYLAAANTELDIITLIGINATFVVMIILSPYFTAQFVSGQAMGPFAVMASSFMAAKTLSITKMLGSRSTRDSVRQVVSRSMDGAKTTMKIMSMTKTALQNHVFNGSKDKQ